MLATPYDPSIQIQIIIQRLYLSYVWHYTPLISNRKEISNPYNSI